MRGKAYEEVKGGDDEDVKPYAQMKGRPDDDEDVKPYAQMKGRPDDDEDVKPYAQMRAEGSGSEDEEDVKPYAQMRAEESSANSVRSKTLVCLHSRSHTHTTRKPPECRLRGGVWHKQLDRLCSSCAIVVAGCAGELERCQSSSGTAAERKPLQQPRRGTCICAWRL
jgi:hypothetical protein